MSSPSSSTPVTQHMLTLDTTRRGMMPNDPTSYIPRYWFNIVVLVLTALSVVGNVITRLGNAQALGLSDVQWNWIVLVFSIITALSAAFNPPVTQPPSPMRLQFEREYHEYKLNRQGLTSRRS